MLKFDLVALLRMVLVIAHEVLFTLFSYSINKVVSVYFTRSSLYNTTCSFLSSAFDVATLE